MPTTTKTRQFTGNGPRSRRSLLAAVLTALVARYGWPGLAERIPLRCFSSEPSIASSLKMLRKTPWAREKLEGLYLFMRREERRAGRTGP